MTARRTPYTARGIRRVPCTRCGAPGHASWQVCADGRVFRALCRRCDVALNALVLRWVGDPDRAAKMATYRKRVLERVRP